MNTISLKMDDQMLGEIDDVVGKSNFSTRTEFIRTSIRDKLKKMTRDELIKEFMKGHGSIKRKTTDKDWEKAREEAVKELFEEKNWSLD